MGAKEIVEDMVKKTTVHTLKLLENDYFQGELEDIRESYHEKYGEEEGEENFQRDARAFMLVPVRSMAGLFSNMVLMYTFAFTSTDGSEESREASHGRIDELHTFVTDSYETLAEIAHRWAEDEGIDTHYFD